MSQSIVIGGFNGILDRRLTTPSTASKIKLPLHESSFGNPNLSCVFLLAQMHTSDHSLPLLYEPPRLATPSNFLTDLNSSDEAAGMFPSRNA